METELESPPKCRVAAVVPAAGCGQRMGNPTPKQYLQVCGRPLILHCLKGLEEVSWVERIVVVADDHTKMADIVRRDGLSKVIVTEGTGSRHLSIRAGVEELSSDAPDVVVVQDGVRPLMPLEILTKVVKAAEEHGASGAVRSLVSTVVKPDEAGFLQESLVRSQFLNSEMPQAFRYSVLRQAYQRCTEYEMEHGTECLALALTHCGVKAKLIPGPSQLWKVTDEKDLAVARIVVPKYTRRIVVACQALSSSSPVQESKFRDSPKPEGPKIHSEECTFLPSGAIPSTEAEPSHTDAQTMSSVSKTGQNEYEIRSDQDKNSRNTAVKPFQTEDPCLCCDRECLRVYKTLQESLETNSQRVSVSDHLDTSWDAACSLVVISNLEILTSFKGYLKYLCQQLDKRLITVILILTLNDNIKDLTFMNISSMQHSIIEASNGITANVTVVLRKRRAGGLKRRLTEFQGEDQASTSKPHTTGKESIVPSSSQVAVEERIPSGTCKSRAQAITSSSGIHKHEVAAETKVPTRDYEEEEEEWRTPDPKLANMIKTILDEQTGCFNGQVMLLEEEKEHLE